MLQTFKTALIIFLLLTLLTGVVYPAVVTVMAQIAFPSRAGGSLLMSDDAAVGSELIGQSFSSPKHFWGRPSATGPFPYNSLGGSGSNQATTNPALADAVRERVAALQAADPGNKSSIPIDLVTASASGLDPHISPAAAFYQVPRVAKERGMAEDKLQQLVKRQIEPPTLGVLGQSRVNVLKLNLALETANLP